MDIQNIHIRTMLDFEEDIDNNKLLGSITLTTARFLLMDLYL